MPQLLAWWAGAAGWEKAELKQADKRRASGRLNCRELTVESLTLETFSTENPLLANLQVSYKFASGPSEDLQYKFEQTEGL